MFEIILIIAATLFLLHKINTLQDRVNVLEKKPSGQTVQPTAQVTQISVPQNTSAPAPAPVAVKYVPKPTPVDNEEWWGRALGISGVIAVLLGISFFLRYAFVNNLIGETGRVMIGIVAGIIFISIGQYVRAKYRTYSNILMAGGIGLLYLTTFAAFAFYNLISSPVAYGLLIGITAMSVVFSIIDDAMSLAVLGVIGGFLTPLFITLSNASLSQVLTYVLILDIGVMVVAYVYKWRKLTGVAFIGTWLLVFSTFVSIYEKTDKFTMSFYLFLYFIVFLASSVFHHIVRKEKSDSDDLIIIVVNALSYSGVTYYLLNDTFKDAMGFFMVLLALIYFAVAFLSFKTNKENTLLNMFLPAMSALFLTLAIPAQFNGPWIALAWFVEALILYIIDYTLEGKNLYSYGAVVFVVSCLYTVARYSDDIVYGVGFKFLWNERFFIFLVGIVTAYLLAFIIKTAMATKTDLTESVKKLVIFYFFVAQVASIFILTSEVTQLYASRVYGQAQSLNKEISQLQQNYYSNNSSGASQNMTQGEMDRNQKDIQDKYLEISNLTTSNANQKNTAIYIMWVLYSLIAFAIGFGMKSRAFRTTGMVLMGITALKFFVDMWSLGQVYRIVTSLVFGVIALVASFVYAKYRNKLHPSVTGTMMLFLAIGLALGGSTKSLEAATDKSIIESLPYRVEINSSSLFQGRPARFIVTPDIQEKTDITDLRVFTGTSNQVPYMLSYSANGAAAQIVSIPVSNLSERNGQLAFLLKQKNGSLTHNTLNFSLSDSVDGFKTNFRYAVEVYGSDQDLSIDSSNWRRLSLGDQNVSRPQNIFNFYDEGSKKYLSSLDVAYEPSNAQYIKVVLTPFSNTLLAFKPKSVELVGFTTQSSLVSGLNGTSITKNATVSENSKNKSTEITVNFANKGSLTDRVYFKTSSSNFYRHVVVQAMNDYYSNNQASYGGYVIPTVGSWQTIGDGEIYSLSKDNGSKLENLSVSYSMTKAMHYRFIITNLDNEPLNIDSSVTFNSPVVALTFVPRTPGPFYLYFGGDLPSPIYDIDAVLSGNSLKEKDISTVSLAGIDINPLYKAPAGAVVPFTEKYPWFLNGILAVLIAFIGFFIFIYVRKMRRG